MITPPCNESLDVCCHSTLQDSHIRDFMESVENVKCGKSYLLSLSSKQLRLGFYGMFRKSPFAPLDTFLVGFWATKLLNGFWWFRLGCVETIFDIFEIVESTIFQVSRTVLNYLNHVRKKQWEIRIDWVAGSVQSQYS